MPTFVLIHSPLVGPFTWTLVAEELRQRGFEAVAPTLRNDPTSSLPYWKQHANAIAEALATLAHDRPIILVGHSGAGMLLPAIREVANRPVAAYIFVDTGIPQDGMSRLDLFSDSEEVARFRQAATDGLLPTWIDEDLREVIPNEEVRRRFVSELRPVPLAVYEEPLPVFEGWPDAPCAYLRFTGTPAAAYEEAVQRAQRERWPYAALDGGHFHMLVDPVVVADALVHLAGQMGIFVVHRTNAVRV